MKNYDFMMCVVFAFGVYSGLPRVVVAEMCMQIWVLIRGTSDGGK